MIRLDLPDLLASPGELARLREVLGRGGVAAVPTETSYALAADPSSASGVSRIFEIKRRDDGKPLIVLFSSRGQLGSLGVAASTSTLDSFFGVWPAPLTVIVPLDRPIAASRASSTLAIRQPAHPGLRGLLSAVGPLTGTSANRAGHPPLNDPEEVARELGSEIDVLVDGGLAPGGAPSTLVDATREPPVVVRPGPFAWPRPPG